MGAREADAPGAGGGAGRCRVRTLWFLCRCAVAGVVGVRTVAARIIAAPGEAANVAFFFVTIIVFLVV